MNLRRIALTSLVVVAALSSGCVLDGTEQIPADGEEPIAEVQQNIDPATAIGMAYITSETLKNLTDSAATVASLFGQKSSGTTYDPRVTQILSELSEMRAELQEMHAKMDQMLGMLNAINYRLDFNERQNLLLWLESIMAESSTAIDMLASWVQGGRKNDSMLSSAMELSSNALHSFDAGANSIKYFYTTHDGATKWDYRVALPYHVYAANVRATVLATVYSNAYRIPSSDGTVLLTQANAMDAVWTKGAAEIRVTTVPVVSGNKFTVGWWGTVKDGLSNTQPDTGLKCMGDERERLCAFHDITQPSTWWNFTTQANAEQVNKNLNPWFRTRAEEFYGIYYAHKEASSLRKIADTRRTFIITR